MKKIVWAVISVLMCLSLVIPIGVTAFAKNEETTAVTQEATSIEDYIAQSGSDVTVVNADGQKSLLNTGSTSIKIALMKSLAKVVNVLTNTVITTLGKAIGVFIPATSALHDLAEFDLDSYENFYPGMSEFLDTPAQGAQWSLGYAEASIMPADFGEKAYAMGGYGLMANTTEKFDDLMVRVIVLNDGSGRGSVAFAVLDAIGIANADVRLVRAALADFAKENNIVSINVSVTHTHSGIDLEGVWANTVENVLNNLFLSTLGLTQIKSGVDRTFLQTIIDQTSACVKKAYKGMEKGSMTLAVKDIETKYLRDRTAPYTFDGNLYRLEFTPDNASSTPTMIATFSAHPENSGYGFTVISADFVPYIEEVLNAAGYNFIYIQGCIGTITYQRGASDDGLDLNRYEEAVRYGHEIGYIILGMTLSETDCEDLNLKLGDLMGVAEYSRNAGYSIWYENWEPVKETEVAPMLNIASKQYLIENTNALLNIVGKTGITDFYFLKDYTTGKYYSVTECGYMELGDSLKVYISPGENYGELLKGGEGMEGFEFAPLREMYGQNMIVFDLMNDAIGYIEPDNEFVMAGIQYSTKNDEFDTDTWCLISWGGKAASKTIGEFVSLVESVR